MKTYKKPEIEITELNSVSVITLSGVDDPYDIGSDAGLSKAKFGSLNVTDF